MSTADEDLLATTVTEARSMRHSTIAELAEELTLRADRVLAAGAPDQDPVEEFFQDFPSWVLIGEVLDAFALALIDARRDGAVSISS